MPYIPPEVVAKAREMDLLTYLRNYEPQELVHFGGSTYCTREHDSLKISNGKWCWFSRGIGGTSALDYLIKVKEIPFMEAVERIIGQAAAQPPVFVSAPKQEKFVHEAEVRRFLHALTTQEKYPFSTPELRRELAHTLWILNRVASVKALAKLLKDDEFSYAFGDCEIVIAAGDGRESDEDAAAAAAYDRVKTAIATHERTITLSVGQLTVGVTIPEWTGVLMLCNLQSPASYMQAAFRAQNPCIFTSGGRRFRKQNSYVFDFDPARTLIIFDEFANNLSPETASGRGTGEDREKNIRRLLNFFPVLGEDEEGQMVELDAKAVLSIPRRLKSQEVVRHGFMSNFLFKNITNIFGAPGIVRQIVEKLTPAQEDPKRNKRDSLDHMGDVPVNGEGEVEIPGAIVIGRTQDVFGPKVYEEMQADIQNSLDSLGAAGPDDIGKRLQDVVAAVKTAVKQKTVEPAADAYDVKPGVRNRMEKQVEREVDASFQKLEDDYRQQTNIARVELERKRQTAESEAEVQKAEEEYSASIAEALKVFTDSAMQEAQAAYDYYLNGWMIYRYKDTNSIIESKLPENTEKSLYIIDDAQKLSSSVIYELTEQAHDNRKIIIAKTISDIFSFDTILITNTDAVKILYIF